MRANTVGSGVSSLPRAAKIPFNVGRRPLLRLSGDLRVNGNRASAVDASGGVGRAPKPGENVARNAFDYSEAAQNLT